MGQYKVPQNVEAEDKIIGPLTLRQFIYVLIGLAYGGVTFFLLKDIPGVFLLIGVPPTLVLLILGLYQRHDQNAETIFLAMLSYFMKSRRRIWEKEPIAEVFRIEEPPIKAEEAFRDPAEIKGQLEKLAHVVDARGFTSKQSSVQEPEAFAPMNMEDRIVAPGAIATPSEPLDVHPADDMLDPNSQASQNINILIQNQSKNIREEAKARVQGTGSGVQEAQPSTLAPQPSNDILKTDQYAPELKVSHVAAAVNKTKQALAEGEPVNLRHA